MGIFNSLVQRKYTRSQELFYYMHQQMVRRAAIDREVLGIKPIVSLDPDQFRRPLGPGYRTGWYARERLGGRKENCVIDDFVYNKTFVDLMDRGYARVKREMRRASTFEKFGEFIDK